MYKNEFDNIDKYKLYREVGELLHPTISKKNISNYRIIIDNDLLPVRVFYPKKVSNIKNIILYIHGEGNITGCDKDYSKISSSFSKIENSLVISIDYDNYSNLDINILCDKIYNTIDKIYKELINSGISNHNMTLIGDSTGGTIILYLNSRFITNNINFNKYVLFYPSINIVHKDKNKLFNKIDKYFKDFNYKLDNNYPNTLILCGKVDPLINEIREFSNNKDNIILKGIPFAGHGFLNSHDNEIINEYTRYLNKFIGGLYGKEKD